MLNAGEMNKSACDGCLAALLHDRRGFIPALPDLLGDKVVTCRFFLAGTRVPGAMRGIAVIESLIPAEHHALLLPLALIHPCRKLCCHDRMR